MDWWQKLKEWFRANPPPADWLTSGPAPDELPLVGRAETLKASWGRDWLNGWFAGATRVDAHPGRVGGPIVPRTVVVHTTDMLPGTVPAIVKSWSGQRGKGNGAHFLIDRDGVVTQMVPVTRNGNHAGGPTHGWYLLDNAVDRLVHPNAWAVGIELDCAGRLDSRGRYRDTGTPLPNATWDDGTRWHLTTPVQMDALRRLLDSLMTVLQPEPKNTGLNPSGAADPVKYVGRTSYGHNGVPWAAHGGPIHGHVTLDPVNKTDPGPFVMRALREWGY